MKRLPYIIWTTVALAAAYLILRTVVSAGGLFVFPDAWQFLDPLRLIGEAGSQLWITVGIHATLTVVLVALSIRRAQEAGWNRWIGLLMIIPVVRLFLFVALAVVPSPVQVNALDIPRRAWLNHLLPRSRVGNAVASIFFAVLLVVPLGFLNVRMLEDYGLALFIGLPFVLGAVSAYLYNHAHTRSLRQSLGIAMLTVTLALAAIFLFAMEGLLCIAMAAPILYTIAFAGALVGHAVSQRAPGGATAMCLLVLATPGLMALEAAHPPATPLFPVVTSVMVQAPPQQVWSELIAFSRMEEPDELLFRAGISYPVEARIDGTGVGACRFCQFNTGPFVEPITVWDEPHLLAFDVLDDPPPMTELTIYEQIDAPHVEGFFRSKNGQFKLMELADGNTLLEGTTWYTHDIWPTWYWRLWSDAILHRIHQRVLAHIKAEAESYPRR